MEEKLNIKALALLMAILCAAAVPVLYPKALLGVFEMADALIFGEGGERSAQESVGPEKTPAGSDNGFGSIVKAFSQNITEKLDRLALFEKEKPDGQKIEGLEGTEKAVIRSQELKPSEIAEEIRKTGGIEIILE